MDEDLKELWQSNTPDESFHGNLDQLKSAYQHEEKKAFKSKIFVTITTVCTAAFLTWMINYYQWTSGFKFYGMLLIILDIVLVNFALWLRSPILELNESKYSLKELNLMMVKNLNEQIFFNRFILPIYGIILTVGIVMVYSEIIPKITQSPSIQIVIYASVIIFITVIMAFGIYRKNKHIKSTIKPLINELNDLENKAELY